MVQTVQPEECMRVGAKLSRHGMLTEVAEQEAAEGSSSNLYIRKTKQ